MRQRRSAEEVDKQEIKVEFKFHKYSDIFHY